MIKRFLLLLIFTSLYSCFQCDHYLTNQKGLRSTKLYKKHLKNRIDPNSVNILTNSTYKSIKYKYDEGAKTFSKITDTLNLKSDYYYRFYENGTYYGFSEKRNTKLNEGSFNTEKGNIGFLVNRGKRNYLMDYSTINCGSFSKWEFEIRKDTLIVKQGSNKGWRMFYYYVKHDVPSEFLNHDTKL